MHAIFADYYSRIAQLHEKMNAALAGLPVAALDWVPGREMSSLAIIATHAAESERHYIHYLVGQHGPSPRERAREFLTQGQDAASLIAVLDDALAKTQATLAGLAPDDLTALRHEPLRQQDLSVAWLLSHTLMHSAEHTGEMGITRQLWQQRQQ